MILTVEKPTQQARDQIMVLKGNWDQFKLIQKGCEQNSRARLFYWDGTIELVMPGRPHEIFAQALGILLALFLAHEGIPFLAVGSADQEREGVASAQPDQSYCLGNIKSIPDLSIEVVFSSGGKSKLSRYQAIGVAEVWFWEDGVLTLYHLRPEGYELIQQSELEGLQQLDLEVLKRHILIGETDTGEAMRSFSAYLQP